MVETQQLDNAIVNKQKWILAHFHITGQLIEHHKRQLYGIEDPLLSRARDVILAGREAVTAVTDYELHQLISDILTNHRPDRVRPTQAAPAGKAAEAMESLFSDVSRYAGFPERPLHTCNNGKRDGAVITVYDDETAVSAITTPAWRQTEKHPQCPGCYHDRVVRQSQQIQQELKRAGRLYWSILDNAEKSKVITRLRKQRERNSIEFVYRVFPLENDESVIVSNEIDGHKMPHDNAQIYELIRQWANTPMGCKVSSSEGWGGDFQGTKGDGRRKHEKKNGTDRKCVQLWTTATVWEVAARLDYKLHLDQTGFSKQIDAAYTAVALQGLELYQKKTNKPGMDALLDYFFPQNDENVTTCGHTENQDSMCLSRDIQPGIEGHSRQNEPKKPKQNPLPGGAK